jgi:pantoate kinase
VSDEALDPVSQGSLGAGLCVDDGVEVIAYGEQGEFGLKISFEGTEGDPSLYDSVLDLLVEEIPEAKGIAWQIGVRLALPISQGFGMSASGAVAAALAFQRAMGLPHEESLRRSYLISHQVERNRSTGLGDVTALAAGGCERRLEAGAPYHGPLLQGGPGRAEGWSCGTPVVLAWRPDAGKHTSSYIDDPDWKDSISRAGAKQMQTLSEGEWGIDRWTELLNSAKCFAEESGIQADSSRIDLLSEADVAIQECNISEETVTLLCMLGESVAIVPSDATSEADWSGPLVSELEKTGLQAIMTRVGETS